MMTTMAAMLGAVPIALGYGAGGEARQPLGLVVVGGLLFSQLVTLYLTPVVFTYMARLQDRLGAVTTQEPLGCLRRRRNSSRRGRSSGVFSLVTIRELTASARRPGTAHATAPRRQAGWRCDELHGMRRRGVGVRERAAGCHTPADRGSREVWPAEPRTRRTAGDGGSILPADDVLHVSGRCGASATSPSHREWRPDTRTAS
jgi:hypothetical protein